MSNFKIGLKTVSILTAVYGWFIPLAFVPSFERDYQTIEITQDLPDTIHMDFDSFFADIEEIEDKIEDEIEAPEEQAEDTPKKKEPLPKPEKTKIPEKTKKEITPKESTPEINSKSKTSATKIPTPPSFHPFEKATRQKKTKTKKRRKTKRCNPNNPDIQLVSRSKSQVSYTLPKSLVKHYSTNWKEANRLASLSWSKDRNGDIRGIKIRHIFCKSPLRHSGLKKGDVVLSVNGKSVASSANLIKLYPRIQFWKEIELDVLRKGKPLTLKYRIQK